MNDEVRMEFSLSFSAWDFIEREKSFGSLADAIECIFIERGELVKTVNELNSTAHQLGIEPAMLSVRASTRSRDYSRWVVSDPSQAKRIAKHSKGYRSHSEAIEQAIEHLKHLRKSEESIKLDCATRLLSERFKQRYQKAS